MTLREQCEAFLREESLLQYDEYTGQEKTASNNALRGALECLCRQQQAVGLREAAKEMREAQEIGDEFSVDYSYFIVWCEQQAREREGMR